MKTLAALTLSILAAGGFIERISRDTNSRAAYARGVESFDRGDYDESVAAMTKAAEIDPGARASYNLGTAQIAAGRNAEGSATLDAAMDDAELRPEALFNRGNSALAASAFEAAIRDYSDVLRIRPDDAAAKRNLEIALRRQQNASQQSSDDEGEQEKEPQQDGENDQPEPGDPEDREAEALLRSVEQQEREELSRMRRSGPATRRIGW